VQAAGGLIGIAVEFTAGMQLGHDDFERRLAGNLRMVLYRNAAAVVGNGQETFGIEMDFDEIGVTGDRFVHRVVDDFREEVVQRLFVGAADIHAGTHAHRFETFENTDRRGAVVFAAALERGWAGRGRFGGNCRCRHSSDRFCGRRLGRHRLGIRRGITEKIVVIVVHLVFHCCLPRCRGGSHTRLILFRITCDSARKPAFSRCRACGLCCQQC